MTTPSSDSDPRFRQSTSTLHDSTLGDLRSSRALWAKGILFLFLGCMASGLLSIQGAGWVTAMLHVIAVWAFCRAYYFAFYVIEHYADPDYRYAGLFDFMRYALSRRR